MHNWNELDKAELVAKVLELTAENDRLKQEIAKLRGAKRPASHAMDTMATKLKEALRE
ncbi:hypothetical protein ABE504_17840 [Paenibacillus oryzisoli]|uniref:hypothetical protein n=1 Tax=Paenibacillus oryzisoli TaxID=1850517 RepID=UPI003D2E9717